MTTGSWQPAAEGPDPAAVDRMGVLELVAAGLPDEHAASSSIEIAAVADFICAAYDIVTTTRTGCGWLLQPVLLRSCGAGWTAMRSVIGVA